MRMNPVLENDMKRNMRSMKSSWVVFGINLLLTIISVAAYFGTASPGGYLSSGQYRYPVKCYMLIAYTLFFMIYLLVPGIAGGSIAIERERKTLDILLTTHLSPWKIVLGKLESSLSMIFLIAFSTLPAVSLILIFGGVSVVDLLALVVILVISGIFIGSIGIFCSAMIRKSTVATIVSYVIVMMLILGTVAILMAGHYFLEARAQQMGNYNSVNMGRWIFLLLLNPLFSYFGLLSHQVGSGNELLEICNYFGEYSGSMVVRHMLLISIMVQIVLSAVLLYAAGKNINPLRK
ncbi:ABC transporter permease [bacterium]|nr:ABC transporter permease [bacterium]MDY3021322.1 ABC transporter permease subunit [Oliverpabstia sp.]